MNPSSHPHPDMQQHASHETRDADGSRDHGGHLLSMLLVCLVIFGAVFLVAERGAGLPGWLPWLFLLLCPLLHLFMHRGHRGH